MYKVYKGSYRGDVKENEGNYLALGFGDVASNDKIQTEKQVETEVYGIFDRVMSNIMVSGSVYNYDNIVYWG